MKDSAVERVGRARTGGRVVGAAEEEAMVGRRGPSGQGGAKGGIEGDQGAGNEARGKAERTVALLGERGWVMRSLGQGRGSNDEAHQTEFVPVGRRRESDALA